MNLAAELAAVLARHDAPTAEAVEWANDWSAKALPLIERANRNKRIRGLFNGKNVNELREQFGLCRRMIYYITGERSAMNRVPDCANAE